MRLALVCLDEKMGTPPLGIAYIASYLRKYANFDNTIIIDKENPMEVIQKKKPDVVGISSVTPEFSKAESLAGRIKDKFEIPVMVGSSHISSIPNNLRDCFDLGVIGEGEQTVLELVSLFENEGSFPVDRLKNIDGLVFHEGDNLHITNTRKQIIPLDNIPFPARDLLKMKEYYLQPRRVPHIPGKIAIGTHIMSSRGCPYHCVFCSSASFWKGIRFHSAEYVVEEIKEVTEKYKINTISILDDLFIADKKRVEEIKELLKKKGLAEEIEFGCFGRTNLIDDKICKTLKEMNVTSVAFGFESGSEKVLNYLKNGTVTQKNNIDAVRICRENNLGVTGSFMVGNPNETKEDLEATRDFIRNNPIDAASLFITTPLPGTELWELAKKDGLVNDDMNWEEADKNFNWTTGDKIPEKTFFPFIGDDKIRLEIYKEIQDEINKINFTKVKFKWKYLFSVSVIKRLLKRPEIALRYLEGLRLKKLR
jgi:radical SAM superfamily enzyme YgiQ (UPF0313 family)